jgi:hypothetical protein
MMSEIDGISTKLGFWSAAIITLLVLVIDAGMALSIVPIPMTIITDIETYAATFGSWQMLHLIPSPINGASFPGAHAPYLSFCPPIKKDTVSAGLLLLHAQCGHP